MFICCFATGMPTFPHWHRLFTVQFEQALKQHGSIIGIPYWDWTAPGRALPPFLTDESHDNPFSHYEISFVKQVGPQAIVLTLSLLQATPGG